MSDTFSPGEGKSGGFDNDEVAYSDAELTEQWDEYDEFGELADRVQTFDQARQSLYELVVDVMSGNKSLETRSDDAVQMGMTVSIRAYEAVATQLVEIYADPDERSRVVKALFMGDESERLGLFRAIAPQIEFIDTRESYIEETHEDLFRELEDNEDIVACLRNLYGANLGADLNAISQSFPKPSEETETKRERRRRKLLGVASDIGKMAAAATLAVIVTKKFPR